jgi:hypothetical protein
MHENRAMKPAEIVLRREQDEQEDTEGVNLTEVNACT